MACALPLIRDFFYFPTRNLVISPMSPKTVRSHKTTAMTTTAFKIDLMEPAIGMYELTSQRRTPTTIRTSTTWIKGMLYSSSCWEIGPAMRRPGNPPGEPLVIGLVNRLLLALFPCRQFPAMIPSPEILSLKIITDKTMSTSTFILVNICIYIFIFVCQAIYLLSI